MNEVKYIRLTQTGVTNFLYCGDYFLFLKRKDTKRVDPGRLNGIGGRLEKGEDYLTAAIRETEEETGYVVKQEDVKLCGVVKLEEGYQEDWVMCFFKIKVPDMNIPVGTETEDGKLIWLHKDKVLDTEYEMVDDIQYCFRDIIEEKNIFFMTAVMDDKQKVITFTKSII